MTNSYNYAICQCDVFDKEALDAFRKKREQWCSWLEDDQDHAIWRALSDLVWQDTTFDTHSRIALEDPESALNNVVLQECIIEGYFVIQTLALRRLVDDSKGVISLRKLIKDMDRSWHLLTRENWVCFDGLPYDYEAVRDKNLANRQPGICWWGHTVGPEAYATSEHLHQLFDRLSGIEAVNRSRSDTLPKSLLKTVKVWLDNSVVNEIVNWSHAHLAHAGNEDKRISVAHFQMTKKKLSAAIRDVARIAEALSGEILGISGRKHALMPVAQFDVFDRLENAVLLQFQRDELLNAWNTRSREWNLALEDVGHELLQRAAGSH